MCTRFHRVLVARVAVLLVCGVYMQVGCTLCIMSLLTHTHAHTRAANATFVKPVFWHQYSCVHMCPSLRRAYSVQCRKPPNSFFDSFSPVQCGVILHCKHTISHSRLLCLRPRMAAEVDELRIFSTTSRRVLVFAFSFDDRRTTTNNANITQTTTITST